jgi:hypothetical protein
MKIAAHVLVVISVVLPVPTSIPAQEYVRESVPKLFSYDELVQLSSDQEMSPEPAEKLKTITATPFINNEAYLSGARAKPLDIPGLGPTLRVAFWNIERVLELDYIELFLTDKNAFMEKVKHEREEAKQNKKAVRSVNLEKIPEQIEILKSADVWILNEVDGGVKRTQYREVIRELGRALNMNWAYGVEFLEIAPAQLGTDTFDDGESNERRQQLLDEFTVDKGIQWTTGVGIVYSGTKAALKTYGHTVPHRSHVREHPWGFTQPGARFFHCASKNSDLAMARPSIFAVFQSARSMGKPALLPTPSSGKARDLRLRLQLN